MLLSGCDRNVQKVLMDVVQKRGFVESLKMKARQYPAKIQGIFLMYHFNRIILVAYCKYVM